MPWTGSGVFNRLFSWQADKAAGINISSSRMDSDTNDIVSSGLGNCLTRDGQGQPTANLPMAGFKHTNVANGSAATDYVAVGQLQPTGNAQSIGITGLAMVGDIKPTALPESALPPGWKVCAGQTRPRTDPLWLATGAVNPANWVWGNGDGSTTYTLPDFRGRSLFGKDDMGGSAANRLTSAVSGVNGTTLGGAGGDQHAQHDTLTASSVSTAVSSAVSAVNDPGHSHGYTIAGNWDGAHNDFAAGTNGSHAATNTSTVGTGITVSTTVSTGVTTTTTVTSALTGASQNIPPAAVVNWIIFCGA